MVPVIALIVWSGIDDADIVFNTIQTNPLFDLGELFDYRTPKFWSFLSLMLLYIIPGFVRWPNLSRLKNQNLEI